MDDSPVVDFHVHLGDAGHWSPGGAELATRFEGTNRWREVFDPAGRLRGERFLELLDAGRVDYAAVIPSRVEGCNDFVANLCAGRPRLIPFVTLNPGVSLDAAADLRRWVEDRGARGLKLLPTYDFFFPNDGRLYPLYAAAEDLGVPVMFHTGSAIFKGTRLKYGDPLLLDDVATDFPGLTIVMAHGGRGFWYEEAFFLSRIHENLYMEISGLPPNRLLGYFPRLEENADKVVFGSDWPGCPGIRENLEAVRSLPVGGRALSKILGLNAARILGLNGRKRGQMC